jgi:hypothetical protein
MHGVLVVMDQFTRRIIGFGMHTAELSMDRHGARCSGKRFQGQRCRSI